MYARAESSANSKQQRAGPDRVLRRGRFHYALAAAVLAVPIVTQDSYLLQVAGAMGIAAMLSLSLGLLYGQTGQISFATAGFMGIGAYSAAVLTTKLGVPFWISLGPALLLPGIVAFVVGIPTLRLRGHYLAIATMALQLGIVSFLTQASALTEGSVGILRMERPTLFGLAFTSPGAYFELVALGFLLSYYVATRMVRSRFGRALTSIREDEVGASSLGIDPAYYKVVVFTMSAMIAGLAGALLAYQLLFINPSNFDLPQSVTVLTMVVIGGVGSNAGAVLGAVFVTLVRQLLFGTGQLEFLVFGLAIVATVVFFPKGLIGIVSRVTRFVSDHARTAPPALDRDPAGPRQA